MQVWKCDLAYADLRWMAKRACRRTQDKRKLQKRHFSVALSAPVLRKTTGNLSTDVLKSRAATGSLRVS